MESLLQIFGSRRRRGLSSPSWRYRRGWSGHLESITVNPIFVVEWLLYLRYSLNVREERRVDATSANEAWIVSTIRRRKHVEMEQVLSDELEMCSKMIVCRVRGCCAQDPRIKLYHFNWSLYQTYFRDLQIRSLSLRPKLLSNDDNW
jgi:hypothetical protein